VRRVDDIADASHGLRSFTGRNSRHNLEEFTGLRPGRNFQAQDVLPQKFESRFAAGGIKIHDPVCGAWVGGSHHAAISHTYHTEWARFFARSPDPPEDQILDFASQLARWYQFHVYF